MIRGVSSASCLQGVGGVWGFPVLVTGSEASGPECGAVVPVSVS